MQNTLRLSNGGTQMWHIEPTKGGSEFATKLSWTRHVEERFSEIGLPLVHVSTCAHAFSHIKCRSAPSELVIRWWSISLSTESRDSRQMEDSECNESREVAYLYYTAGTHTAHTETPYICRGSTVHSWVNDERLVRWMWRKTGREWAR